MDTWIGSLPYISNLDNMNLRPRDRPRTPKLSNVDAAKDELKRLLYKYEHDESLTFTSPMKKVEEVLHLLSGDGERGSTSRKDGKRVGRSGESGSSSRGGRKLDRGRTLMIML